ncbi:MAG: LPS assembly lipoprotein LptE [Pseudomonadota bacterium]
MRGFVLIGLMGVLCSCGFQLRTYDISTNIESFAITGKTRIAVAEPLNRTLRQAGLAQNIDSPAVTVELLDQRRERRSISTAGQARAAEYETTYGVQYRLLGSAGEELLAPTWIERVRVYRIDRDNIVGSSEEQAILERELMQDVVGQIVRSMDAVSRSQTG